MEKLRIHKMKYRNRGIANKELKGVNEIHVIFKFNTDKEATEFITKVKEWHYGLEKVGEKIIKAIKDEPKTVTAKKPVPAKRKTSRPSKKVVQG